MSLLYIAGVALLIALVLAWAHYTYWVRRLTLELEYAETESIPTEDGVAVVLRRLPRYGELEDETPVLLVHGLALNHRNQDMTDDLSLGRHLARAGRDVWLLTLRSGREDLTWAEERRVTFEAMARSDVPVGIRAVLERTGAERLDYVGFSMGGMLMYACLGRTVPEASLRKVVILGSPAEIRPPLAILSKVARFVPQWVVPTLRLRLVSRFLAFAADLIHTPIHRWVYNPDNVDRGVAGHALVNGFVNIPNGLANEFVRWSWSDGAVRYEDVDVTLSLRSARTPVLFVAGAGDRLAPPSAVRLAHDAWGAAHGEIDKTFRVAGVEEGAAADYGHGDLAIGRYADVDVFDPVERWLAARLDERPDA